MTCCSISKGWRSWRASLEISWCLPCISTEQVCLGNTLFIWKIMQWNACTSRARQGRTHKVQHKYVFYNTCSVTFESIDSHQKRQASQLQPISYRVGAHVVIRGHAGLQVVTPEVFEFVDAMKEAIFTTDLQCSGHRFLWLKTMSSPCWDTRSSKTRWRYSTVGKEERDFFKWFGKCVQVIWKRCE